MMQLRDYQSALIHQARARLRHGSSVLVQLCTGGGKTALSSFMSQSAAAKGGRVIFTVPRDFLLDQTADTFEAIGLPYGFIAAGRPMNPYARVQIASMDTLKHRLDRVPAPTLLVVDEAHHAAAAGWSRVVEAYKAAGAKVVGLSATPWRLSGEGLGDWFDSMVCGPPMAELIERGFLSRYRAFAPSRPDLTGVHSRMGDYIKSEVEAAMDKPTITGDAVGHYLKLARGKRAVAFCVSVKHSQHVAEQFRAAGVMAWHLDATTPHGERRAAIKALKAGDLQILTAVDLFGEGFDLPACDAAILLRPTQSLSLYLQQVGRALRVAPGKPHALILDHAGLIATHGLPDDEREWSLAAREKRGRGKADEGDGVAVRTCKSCFGVFKPAPRCPYCGAAVEGQAREVEQVDGELEEVDVEALRRARVVEQARAETLDQLVALGRARGYKDPAKWAGHVYTSRLAKRGERAYA